MNTTNKTFNQTDNVFSERAIAAFRSDTEGCNHVIHLNNAGASLMPNVVTQSILDHIKLESQIGGYEASALRADAIRQCYLASFARPQANTLYVLESLPVPRTGIDGFVFYHNAVDDS